MWRFILLFCLGISACNLDSINPFLEEEAAQTQYPDTTVLQLRPITRVKYALNDSIYFLRDFDEQQQLRAEVHYLNGKKDGPEKQWSGSGRLLLDAYWQEGKLWGEYTAWFDSGLKSEEATYDKQGRLLSRRVWHPNGQLESRAYYLDGKIDGQVVHYLKDGRVGEVFHYNKGKILYITVENKEVPELNPVAADF